MNIPSLGPSIKAVLKVFGLGTSTAIIGGDGAGGIVAKTAGTDYKAVPIQQDYTTTDTAPVNVGTAGADVYVNISALAETLTVEAPTGTPKNGQNLIYTIIDDGTGRTLNFTNAIFRVVAVSAPTITTASKITTVGCKWHSGLSKWLVYTAPQE